MAVLCKALKIESLNKYLLNIFVFNEVNQSHSTKIY